MDKYIFMTFYRGTKEIYLITKERPNRSMTKERDLPSQAKGYSYKSFKTMEAKARRSNLRCEGEDASDIGGKSDGGPKSYSETVALVLRRWA